MLIFTKVCFRGSLALINFYEKEANQLVRLISIFFRDGCAHLNSSAGTREEWAPVRPREPNSHRSDTTIWIKEKKNKVTTSHKYTQNNIHFFSQDSFYTLKKDRFGKSITYSKSPHRQNRFLTLSAQWIFTQVRDGISNSVTFVPLFALGRLPADS